jgi:hypothetical protein
MIQADEAVKLIGVTGTHARMVAAHHLHQRDGHTQASRTPLVHATFCPGDEFVWRIFTLYNK